MALHLSICLASLSSESTKWEASKMQTNFLPFLLIPIKHSWQNMQAKFVYKIIKFLTIRLSIWTEKELKVIVKTIKVEGNVLII